MKELSEKDNPVINLQHAIKALTNQRTTLKLTFNDVVIDSRQASDSSLFIALPGEKVDGHDFVKAAFTNGACAALVDKTMPGDMPVLDLRPEHFHPPDEMPSLPLCLRVEDTLKALQTMAAYWREQHTIRTIGITGSVGKTSTKELTAAVLSRHYHVLKNPGNLNNEIGLPLTLLALDNEHEIAVLEMGFYVPGEIRMLCRIAKPQIGILTNIGTVHAARAGSIEAIARGKAE